MPTGIGRSERGHQRAPERKQRSALESRPTPEWSPRGNRAGSAYRVTSGKYAGQTRLTAWMYLGLTSVSSNSSEPTVSATV